MTRYTYISWRSYISATSRLHLGNISATSRLHLGYISSTRGGDVEHVEVVRSYISAISRLYLGLRVEGFYDISAISRPYLGYISAISRLYLGLQVEGFYEGDVAGQADFSSALPTWGVVCGTVSAKGLING